MKPTHLREESHYRDRYHLQLSAGETLETALKPDFWNHVARKLRPLYEVVLYAHDLSWRADLLVRSATPTEVRVVVIGYVDLAAADAKAREFSQASTLEAVHKGPVLKWCVVRHSDNVRLAERLETKDEALEWIKNPPQPAQAAA